jgi:deoxyribodipyrimidine photo-lyase
VDSNGIIPLDAADRAYPSAYSFRGFVHKWLAAHGAPLPSDDPLRRVKLPRLSALPVDVTRRWPLATSLDDPAPHVAGIAIDHSVSAVATVGGSRAAAAALRRFLDRGLEAYAQGRNDPDREASSGLSAYLHFGHIGAHQLVAAMMDRGLWSPDRVETSARGSRAGWGTPEAAGAFLDQLVTWRELGFNMCAHEPRYDRFESLPAWALRTLSEHADDPREWRYSLEEFAGSATHDEVWNAAQRQLRATGTIHNYMRMLWGKKILEWSESPREALAVMIELNNRYALDGRDPNSYSGIFWTLGRYDRAWGPERPVFGKIRYMSSASASRKFNLAGYLARFGPHGDTSSSPS